MRRLWSSLIIAAMLLPGGIIASGERVLTVTGTSHPAEDRHDQDEVRHRCLTPMPQNPIDLGLDRTHRLALPRRALADGYQRTIHCLVARLNFQYESPDDPTTTGPGQMDVRRLLESQDDSAAWFDSAGYWIDPPPHDTGYFGAHIRALSRYWETVSEGHIQLTYDVWPPGRDAAYELPHPMSYYGACDLQRPTVVTGLLRYFVDAVRAIDSVSPEIVFSDYDAVFLFHAGADQQNNFAGSLTPTCNDLFTGYLEFAASDTVWIDDSTFVVGAVPVDDGTDSVRTGMLMPEFASQDERATALNAVMAHEFGHALGLIDLYRTSDFKTMLGDFALMDNNGNNTGYDFAGFRTSAFGCIPVYPCAWSRAYLGFVEVEDYRAGEDIFLAAAEVPSATPKIVRVPITEHEYYLLEVRLKDVDDTTTGVKQDSATSVVMGPVQVICDSIIGNDTICYAGRMTSEYDDLIPGSGLMILHVDESVANYPVQVSDGATETLFSLNCAQCLPDRRFVRLVEGDGIVHFGRNYRAGYGRAEDLYRDDRNDEFTPGSNPPSIDNTGNNTRINITGITRHKDTIGVTILVYDTLMKFDLDTRNLMPDFPVRAGLPSRSLSPIAADLDRDGDDEILVPSGNRLLAITTSGRSFLSEVWGAPDSVVLDTIRSYVDSARVDTVPIFGYGATEIVSGPVVGDFGNPSATMIVATGRSGGIVEMRYASDTEPNGLGDSAMVFFTIGNPIALMFGEVLYGLTDAGVVFKLDSVLATPHELGTFAHDTYHGVCRAGDGLILSAGDEDQTVWYSIEPDGTYDSLVVTGEFNFGPILVDLDRNGTPEIVGFSRDGQGILISVDMHETPAAVSIRAQEKTGFEMTTNPIAGDVNDDGYPELLIGGRNRIIAFDRNLTLVADFPKEVDDRFPTSDVIAAPVVADIQHGGQPEVILPTEPGNIYAFGEELASGFPLSGGEFTIGSPVIVRDSLRGMLGYLGADGWFYLWQTDADSTRNFWPMAGANPFGTLVFDQSKLTEPRQYAESFDESKYFNYPNPVTSGRTTIRYFLGRDARRVQLRVFDLSGREIAEFDGPTNGGVDNEYDWSCDDVTPGVYRCRIEVDFGNETTTAFTDIAIIR